MEYAPYLKKDIEVPSLVDGKRRYLALVRNFVSCQDTQSLTSASPKTHNHSRVQDTSSFLPRVMEPVSPTIKRRHLHVLP